MTDEKLTAEERELLQRYQQRMPYQAVLACMHAVELYDLEHRAAGDLAADLKQVRSEGDAALARAEAAEECASELRGQYAEKSDSLILAESALAEMTSRAKAAEQQVAGLALALDMSIEGQRQQMEEYRGRSDTEKAAREARAEAAEKKLNGARNAFFAEGERRMSAESRLAAATALLERCGDELITDPSDDPVTLQLDYDLGVFTGRRPANPAPAATAEPGYGESGGDAEHPDTIALKACQEASDISLRECRSELARITHDLQADLAQEKADHAVTGASRFDAEAALASARAERNTARAGLDQLARDVGKALVAATLRPGESLAEPPEHAIVSTVLAMRAELEKWNQRAYDFLTSDTLRAERDTAREELRKSREDWDAERVDKLNALALVERIEAELDASSADLFEAKDDAAVIRALQTSRLHIRELIRASKGEDAFALQARLMAAEKRVAELEESETNSLDIIGKLAARVAELEADLERERAEHAFAIRTQTMQLARERDDALARVKGGIRHRESIGREWDAERARDDARKRVAELERDVKRETARALEAERQCGEHVRLGDGHWDRMIAAENRVSDLKRERDLDRADYEKGRLELWNQAKTLERERAAALGCAQQRASACGPAARPHQASGACGRGA